MKTLIKILFSLIMVINVAQGEILINDNLLNFSPSDTTIQNLDNSEKRNYPLAISEILGFQYCNLVLEL